MAEERLYCHLLMSVHSADMSPSLAKGWMRSSWHTPQRPPEPPMRVRQEVGEPLLQGDSFKTGGLCEGCKRGIHSPMIDNHGLEDLLKD